MGTSRIDRTVVRLIGLINGRLAVIKRLRPFEGEARTMYLDIPVSPHVNLLETQEAPAIKDTAGASII
jgi:hypothetical protein